MKEAHEFMNTIPELDKKVTEIKKKILSNQHLLTYCQENHIELTDEKIQVSLMNLLQFVENDEKCLKCKGLASCTQLNQGYRPHLKDLSSFVHLTYQPCDYQKMYHAHLEVERHVQSFYMPKKILNASLDQIDITSGKSEAIKKVATFAKSYTPDKFKKGAYISGAFGVGKTYLLAAMANALAKRHISVALVYLPDMIRELKNAIGKSNFETVFAKIKNVQVLILDDIGSEMNTQWMRDEVLGPILQYRMLEELPTFFTSNKTISELIKDYATTNDRVVSVSKAERIGDRIKALADEYTISGKNYRY